MKLIRNSLYFVRGPDEVIFLCSECEGWTAGPRGHSYRLQHPLIKTGWSFGGLLTMSKEDSTRCCKNMSTENLAKFTAAIEQNPEWLERVRAITGSPEESARQLAAFSEEVGFPVAADEFLSTASEDAELSGDELSDIAGGGRGYPDTHWVHNRITGEKKRRVHETE